MATISELTAATSALPASVFEVEVSGNSRSIALSAILTSLGITSSTVAGLGSAATANIFKYATDGRKTGEGVGAGTGVLVRSTGSVWQTVQAATTVSA